MGEMGDCGEWWHGEVGLVWVCRDTLDCDWWKAEWGNGMVYWENNIIFPWVDHNSNSFYAFWCLVAHLTFSKFSLPAEHVSNGTDSITETAIRELSQQKHGTSGMQTTTTTVVITGVQRVNSSYLFYNVFSFIEFISTVLTLKLVCSWSAHSCTQHRKLAVQNRLVNCAGGQHRTRRFQQVYNLKRIRNRSFISSLLWASWLGKYRVYLCRAYRHRPGHWRQFQQQKHQVSYQHCSRISYLTRMHACMHACMLAWAVLHACKWTTMNGANHDCFVLELICVSACLKFTHLSTHLPITSSVNSLSLYKFCQLTYPLQVLSTNLSITSSVN